MKIQSRFGRSLRSSYSRIVRKIYRNRCMFMRHAVKLFYCTALAYRGSKNYRFIVIVLCTLIVQFISDTLR